MLQIQMRFNQVAEIRTSITKWIPKKTMEEIIHSCGDLISKMILTNLGQLTAGWQSVRSDHIKTISPDSKILKDQGLDIKSMNCYGIPWASIILTTKTGKFG